jgi:hypothetical protein
LRHTPGELPKITQTYATCHTHAVHFFNQNRICLLKPILAPRCWPVPGACDNDEKAKAWNRLGICGCCEHADRLKTKFVADAEGDWSYYPNPECITKECPLQPVPNDIVHQDGIHALNPYDDRLPEFDQMRREGVLFIYQGEPACFWPPEQSDG